MVSFIGCDSGIINFLWRKRERSGRFLPAVACLTDRDDSFLRKVHYTLSSLAGYG